MLGKLFEKFQQTYTAFDSSLAQFVQPDINALSEALDLEKKARENGAKNVPSSSTKTKDAQAKSIDHAIASIVNQGKEGLINYLNGAAGLSITQSETAAAESEVVLQEKLSNLQEAAKKSVIQLFTLKSSVIRGETALKDFRQKNNLIRNSYEPTSIWTAMGVIAFFVLGEVALNAFTLSDASPTGFRGVIEETLFFTFANILLACITGFFVIRQINHVSKLRKVFFTLLSTALVSFIGLMNLSFAHYRGAKLELINSDVSDDLFLQRAAEVFPRALETLHTSPLLLSDAKGYTLFILGCILAFFATYKAYGLDDPYPGYGKLSRQQQLQADDYLSDVEDFFEELSGIVEEGVAELQNFSASAANSKNQIQQRNLENEKLKAKYASWLNMVESCGESLYATYREINESERTAKRPYCFDIPFQMLPDASEYPQISQVNPEKISVFDNGKRIKKLYSALSDYREHFKTLENLSPEGELLDEKDESLNAIDMIGRKYTDTSSKLGE